MAGYVPKTTPTTTDTLRASDSARNEIRTGQPAMLAIADVVKIPSPTPSTPPMTVNQTLGQKLSHHVISGGSDRTSKPDFRGAFDDRRQHNVHDADTTDYQRDERNAPDDDSKCPLGLIALGEKFLRHDDLVSPTLWSCPP